MKKIVSVSVAAAIAVAMSSAVLVATPAAAQAKKPNPFSDCGIGAAIFQNTPWAAAISNVIWDLGTTAVTSALASPGTCNGSRYTAALYINETYARLESDAAKGQGEYLTALADVMACNEQGKTELYRAVRMGYAEKLSTEGFTELSKVQKAEQLFNVVDNAVSGDLAGKCTLS